MAKRAKQEWVPKVGERVSVVDNKSLLVGHEGEITAITTYMDELGEMIAVDVDDYDLRIAFFYQDELEPIRA